MTVEFERITRIAATPRAAFDASCDIELHLDSMRSSGERAVAGVTSGRIGPGEQVTWSARHFGVRFRMTSRITAYDRPHRFVDEQLRGPFAVFRHEHRFEPADGGTVMRDHVRFRAPFGPLGRLVEPVLRRHLVQLIDQRNQYVATAAERAAGDRA
ncbi:SRPBCC family protein [Agromyces mediolanus]|uniref:SRPBCC family protein n=1 Tax=Agromyces mediolanus TaxID=41986 RepID=UPI003832B4F2